MLSKNTENEIVYTFPFCFLLLEYIFGMYLNDVLPSFLKYSDEVLSVVLLLWTIVFSLRKGEFFNKEIRIFIIITSFFLIYSILIQSNKLVAIFADLLIQLKPFIAFYMFTYMGFVLNNSQKKILKRISVLLFIVMAAITMISIPTVGLTRGLTIVFGHVNSYGVNLILIALTYLYCSDIEKKKDLIIFFLILTFSLFSTRAKIYGVYAIIIYLVFVLKGNFDIKISLKSVLTISILFLLAIYLSWDKIRFYFIDYDVVGSDYALARPLLYITGWEILFDYFPFGSGFASFATHYSGVYYSNIYEIYGLDMVWGLQEDDPGFVTDTGYPFIAQFGVVGLALYFLFFKRIISSINNTKQANKKNYLIVLLLLLTLLIQCIADATFTSNRGFYIMMLIALLLTDNREKSKELKTNV